MDAILNSVLLSAGSPIPLAIDARPLLLTALNVTDRGGGYVIAVKEHRYEGVRLSGKRIGGAIVRKGWHIFSRYTPYFVARGKNLYMTTLAWVRLLLLSFFVGHIATGFGQTVIQGQAPAAYRGQLVHLDVLDTPEDILMIADYMMLPPAAIDSSGSFRLNVRALPDRPSFYRVRYRMRDDPPVSMHFGRRHYLTTVLRAGDTLSVDGLTLVEGSVVAGELNRIEDYMDQYANITGSYLELNREEKLKLEHRLGYLRDLLASATASPYAKIYALGQLPAPIARLQEVRAAREAVEQTELPRSYYAAVATQYASLAYDGLRTRTRWLTGALLASLLLCGYLAWRLWGRSTPVRDESVAEDTTTELSHKELEVYALIRSGATNKEIAAQLFISVSTVKTHINSIYRKMGVSRRAELISTPV